MRANITIFIDPRQEFDGRLNGFVWVLDYELPSAFVWLIVSLWVMSPCVTGDGQLFIKPRPQPLIGQRSPGRRLIGPWCPVICVQRVCVRAAVCPHSIISRQMTCSSLYHMSAPHTRRWRENRDLPKSNVQIRQFTIYMTDGMILSQGSVFSQSDAGDGARPPIRSQIWLHGENHGWARAALHSQDIQNWWSIKI